MSVEIAELAVPYAVLILHDAKQAVTTDAILAILAAANIEVEKVWAEIFARAFANPDSVSKLIDAISSGAAAAPAAASAAPQAAAAASTPAAAKEDKKKPAKEESDEEMGFGLFD